MGLANSKVMRMSASATGYGGSATSMAMGGLNKPKEYDEKMIIHMYKSLMMAKGQLVPRDAAHKWPHKSLARGETIMVNNMFGFSFRTPKLWFG